MSKRINLLVVVALVSSFVLAQTTEGEGIHPYKPVSNPTTETGHWSLWIEGGFNSFDGDFTSELKNAISAPTVGIALEYNFTPTWGLGGQYLYSMYNAKGAEGLPEYLLKGQMHRADAFLSFDLVNAWFPTEVSKIVSLNILAGGGVAFKKNSIYYPEKGNTASVASKEDEKFKSAAYFLGGVGLDFNVSRNMALGLKATYNLFAADDIDGRNEFGANNDGLFDVTMTLRYKFESKRKSHVRNYASNEELNRQYAIANQEIEEEKARIKDTIVIYHRDTIVMAGGNAYAQLTPEEAFNELIKQSASYRRYFNTYYVYYATDKDIINDEGLVTIQQVGNRMQYDTEMYAVLIGSCDNTGSKGYNRKLGLQRVKAVNNELTQVYEISQDRVAYFSDGIIENVKGKTSYTPNRRTEIRLVNKDEFEALKKQYSQEIEQTQKENITSVKESAEEGNTITATANMTLSKLARKYYNNTHCWIYIFQANHIRLKTPNFIKEGTKLVIPELTDEQKAITKEQAHEIYEGMK